MFTIELNIVYIDIRVAEVMPHPVYGVISYNSANIQDRNIVKI